MSWHTVLTYVAGIFLYESFFSWKILFQNENFYLKCGFGLLSWQWKISDFIFIYLISFLNFIFIYLSLPYFCGPHFSLLSS